MDQDFWLQCWHSGRLGWHLEQVNPHLVQLWPEIGAPPPSHVFVPLCGKTRDLAWLADRGHAVVGVEISERGVQEFFADRGWEPEVTELGAFRRYRAAPVTVLCGDFFDLTAEALGPVAAVFDRAALIALPPNMRRRYAAHLQRLLPHRPPILVITLEYPPGRMEGPPFAVTEQEIVTLFGSEWRIRRLRDLDVLDEHPRFREKGLTALREKALLLTAEWASPVGGEGPQGQLTAQTGRGDPSLPERLPASRPGHPGRPHP